MFYTYGDTKPYDKVQGADANLLKVSLSKGEEYIKAALYHGEFRKTLYKHFLNETEEDCVLPLLRKSLTTQLLSHTRMANEEHHEEHLVALV